MAPYLVESRASPAAISGFISPVRAGEGKHAFDVVVRGTAVRMRNEPGPEPFIINLHMEVIIMGDIVPNIHNSTIVNRSLVQGAFNLDSP